MNIYAVRDRLLDYYMQPFAGPGEKQVLASVATMINSGEQLSDIAQAPHHFEVWELGKIDEEGHITPTHTLICDCASLVRPGLRDRRAQPGAETQNPPGGSQSPLQRTGVRTDADGHPLPHQAQQPTSATEEVRHGPRGGYPPRSDG